MKKSTSTVAQKNVTNVRLFVLFVLLVLSSVGVFGQNKAIVLPTTTATETLILTDVTIVVTNDYAVASTQSDFALWFMGSKQTTPFLDATTTSGTVKRQFVTSGISPNKVLIRTFLKRLVNKGSNIA
jgi:hypothetical protein